MLRSLAVGLLLQTIASTSAGVPPVPAEMRDPAFWIIRVKSPDRPLLDQESILQANTVPYRLGFLVRPWIIPRSVQGSGIRKALQADLAELSRWIKYDDRGQRLRDPGFRNSMEALMAPNTIGTSLQVRYGQAVRRTEVRRAPSSEPIRRKPDDHAFDILNLNILDAGDRVTAYHLSANSRWAYAQTPACLGWVLRADFGWSPAPSPDTPWPERLVVSGPIEVISRDPAGSTGFVTASMATGFPLEGREPDGRWRIRLPARGSGGELVTATGWLRPDADVSRGPLPLTPRHLARQAFKYLGAGYAWGGTGQAVDCSGFLANILGACGIGMPRSAASQARVFGRTELTGGRADRIAQIAALPPLQTIVEFAGHIGLLLGTVDGHPWLIHAVSELSYGARKHIVNEVVITNIAGHHGTPPMTLTILPIAVSIIGSIPPP